MWAHVAVNIAAHVDRVWRHAFPAAGDVVRVRVSASLGLTGPVARKDAAVASRVLFKTLKFPLLLLVDCPFPKYLSESHP